jgi:hypothetical protein
MGKGGPPEIFENLSVDLKGWENSFILNYNKKVIKMHFLYICISMPKLTVKLCISSLDCNVSKFKNLKDLTAYYLTNKPNTKKISQSVPFVLWVEISCIRDYFWYFWKKLLSVFEIYSYLWLMLR